MSVSVALSRFGWRPPVVGEPARVLLLVLLGRDMFAASSSSREREREREGSWEACVALVEELALFEALRAVTPFDAFAGRFGGILPVESR